MLNHSVLSINFRFETISVPLEYLVFFSFISFHNKTTTKMHQSEIFYRNFKYSFSNMKYASNWLIYSGYVAEIVQDGPIIVFELCVAFKNRNRPERGGPRRQRPQ